MKSLLSLEGLVQLSSLVATISALPGPAIYSRDGLSAASKQNGPAPSCRCFPGDSCWPSASTWSNFNKTVNGKLIATVPIAASCHNQYYGPYNNASCSSLQSVFTAPATHYESPSSISAPFFTNNSCNPFSSPTDLCVIGAYVQYTVNATCSGDIVKTIKFATDHNIRLVIRNTGLDYNGKSSGAGAIAVWTHHLNSIGFINYKSSNYTGKAIKVGAGVQSIDAFKAASAKGLTVVAGEIPSVGYAGGYTQGGGHSALSSKYGLAADQVLEWEVIDGRGRLLTASPTKNSDLYWALSGGGGGTYGVVTSMTSKAFPDGPVVGANISFSSAGITQDQFFSAIETYHASLPAIVDAGAVSIGFFTNTTFAVSPLTAPGLTEAKVYELFKPLTDKLKAIGAPYQQYVHEYPGYLQEFEALVAPVPVAVGQYGGRFIPRSVVKHNNTALTKAYRYIAEQGATVAAVALNVKHGKTWNSANPKWRDVIIETAIQTIFNYTLPLSVAVEQQQQMTNDFLPRLAALAPNGGAYINEGDFRQPDFQTVFYGSNYQQLNSIKNKYDPNHMFYAVTAVGSEYWTEQPSGRLCRSQ